MKYYKDLALRIILALALGTYYQVYYMIFKPLTLNMSYFFLKMMDGSAALFEDKIITATHTLTFIDACVAAAAYLLLSMLILTTKDITWKKRLKMFVYGSILILVFNIARIELLFFALFRLDYSTYSALHLFIWKFLSTIYVFGVWVFLIRMFKIKTIPVYSDFVHILNLVKKK
ncbi:MAG: pacearchaeosortase [Candidatus Woesearchaeota archaeon]